MTCIRRVTRICLLHALLSGLIACTQPPVSDGPLTQPSDVQPVSPTPGISAALVDSLEARWRAEFLVVEGRAPVIAKYDDMRRNLALAKLAARTNAESELGRMIADVKITQTIVMKDFETSAYVRSELQALLKDVTVAEEGFDADAQEYWVRLQMPKIHLLDAVKAVSN
ncbi:MAG: hypothetical protein KAY32_09860 [Candidatus Eisenbacteria sp.]|nr:hypothetical protein [Candidatus Eisenbacteria bacterium]